jgi:hypothetical protein
MNDHITLEIIMALINTTDADCISLYMPTHPIGTETQQDPIRLRNLLDQAEEKLRAAGYAKMGVEERLASARQLLDDRLFWQNQAEGLALFLSSDGTQQFRLPIGVEELVVVADHFHIKPLLPLMTGDRRFYVLALSQQHLRLYEATRTTMTEVDLADIPTSVNEALPYDDLERQLQYHTGSGSQGDGGRAAIFHGHNVGGSDDKKDALRRFFQQVDAGLMDLLGTDRAPLVIAGVDYVAALYKMVSSYPQHLEQDVTGNPDALSDDDLHDQAWEIVAPTLEAAQTRALSKYGALLAQDQASAKLDLVLQAACTGRVNTAFVNLDRQIWGVMDETSYSLRVDDEPTAENEDLIDLAARQTLAHGGEVYALSSEEMPDNAAVAAFFRY